MQWTDILIAVYVIVALFAMVMAYNEQKQTGNRSLLFNIISYLACTVWPATLAVILISARRRST